MLSVERLLEVLRRRGEARASDLAADLGVSQPTVSRLLTAARDRVCRMGHARAARYAPTRAVAGLETVAPVHQVDEAGAVSEYGAIHPLTGDRHWFEYPDGRGMLFDGLPPFAWDMRPQGYLGRVFPTRFPELGLASRVADWGSDQQLIALARRGEDCVGNLILGGESLTRFFADVPPPLDRGAYPEAMRTALARPTGSSAGGEHPKFLGYVEGRHVLVKFADGEGAASDRWRDLLVCEAMALEAVRAASIPAASARWLDVAGSRFLETERFDRVGPRGRRGVVSLETVNAYYFGYANDSWTKAAKRLRDEPGGVRISPEDVRRMRWLDTFGQLIGNTDRHFGNLTYFVDGAQPPSLRLAPVYDMLPMLFAPQGVSVVEREFKPSPPTADNHDLWDDAARHALAYWDALWGTGELSPRVRDLCRRCLDQVAELTRQRPAGGAK